MTPPHDAELDFLLALACSVFNVSSALVTLADGNEIRFNRFGEIDPNLFAAASALRGEGPDIGFYVATPLSCDAAVCSGTLSVFDRQRREFNEEQGQTFAHIGRLAATVLRQRSDALTVRQLDEQLAAQSQLLGEQAAALAHSKKIFERASAVAKIGVWQCDLTANNALTWTDGVYDLFELPRGSAIKREEIADMYFPEARAEMETLRARMIRERGGFTLDARIKTALGKERWMRLTADIECENGVPVRIFGMKQDITEEKKLWDRARYLAEIDVMTGLANRSLFQTTLSELHGDSVDRLPAGALLLIDLDGFKQVNDTFGHALGDECLKQIATRLREVCHDARLVARIGGDEFAAIIDRPVDRAEAEAYASRILGELRRPVCWREHSFQLGASIGIAIPEIVGPCSADELFTHADIALYAAKEKGKNTFRIFDPRMKQEGDQRFRTVREVARAMEEDRLELYYQPKVRLADGRLSGFEALLRRHLPNGQVVAAGSFQAALVDPELSARLGKWVIEKALGQAALWHQASFDFGNIAINLSASQLHDHRFAGQLIERIGAYGLRPEMIEVEVTEGVFPGEEPGPVKRILERLKQGGIRIALDDFGTGYASLVHLRSYPIDVIKIDRSFVRRFLSSPQDRAILETVLRLGSDLGMEVVAEGIHSTAQLEGLKALGCPFGQGFLFSKALPAAEAVNWLLPGVPFGKRVA